LGLVSLEAKDTTLPATVHLVLLDKIQAENHIFGNVHDYKLGT
jgi:hypothetical protein